MYQTSAKLSPRHASLKGCLSIYNLPHAVGEGYRKRKEIVGSLTEMGAKKLAPVLVPSLRGLAKACDIPAHPSKINVPSTPFSHSGECG